MAENVVKYFTKGDICSSSCQDEVWHKDFFEGRTGYRLRCTWLEILGPFSITLLSTSGTKQ